MRKIFTLLAISLAIASPCMVAANIGPRPPISREEVTDPQDCLRMANEVVDVTVDGERAHVVAKFHFVPVRRNDFKILVLRMGFPELAADAPLENFTVKQDIHVTNGGADSHNAPLPTIGTGPASDAWSKTLGVSRWYTWALELPASLRYNSPESVDIEVSYDQKLHGKGKNLQTTYVLRTGAPWSGTVGSSIVNVRLENGVRFVKGVPSTYKKEGDVVTYSFTDWKPNTDVTFWVAKK